MPDVHLFFPFTSSIGGSEMRTLEIARGLRSGGVDCIRDLLPVSPRLRLHRAGSVDPAHDAGSHSQDGGTTSLCREFPAAHRLAAGLFRCGPCIGRGQRYSSRLQGRKVLVLTERTEHLDAILSALSDRIPEPFLLHGRMSKKQRSALIAALDDLPSNAPRVLLATGKLVGEGFDRSALDTLVLAMPISWKGTLQQYAGRLHPVHTGKIDVRIIDLVDTGHPALLRMWGKRQRGYRAMGYRI